MTIAVADSWEGRSTSATLNVAVTGIEAGDLIVVYTFAAGSGSPNVPTDNGSNTYAELVQSDVDATYTTSLGIASAVCVTVPTQVSVSNSAGGANDVAAVVMRVTHDGTGYLGQMNTGNTSLDDPVSVAAALGDAFVEAGTQLADTGNAVLVAGLTHDGATTTFAPQGGWADVEEEEDAASGIPYSVVSKSVTDSGPHSHQWTTGAARDYSYLVAALTERVPDPVLQGISVAPSPTVTGTTMTVPGFIASGFPDPNVKTYFVLATNDYATANNIVVPSVESAEVLRVISESGGVWTIERAQADTKAQPIDTDWFIWFEHTYADDAFGLLAYFQDYYHRLTGTALSSATGGDTAFSGESMFPVDSATAQSVIGGSTARLSLMIIERSITVASVSIYIGATAGNIDVGIYDSSFALLWSRGSIASPGNGLQTILISAGSPTTLLLDPGVYYAALNTTSGAITFRGTTFGTGYVKAATAPPLPNPLTTPTAATTEHLPWMRLDQ